MKRHNEELLQIGIAMFKKCCSDATSCQINGQTHWSGSSCEGGGWTTRHKMNEDLMTPENVAKECEMKSILTPAREAYQKKILELSKAFIA